MNNEAIIEELVRRMGALEAEIERLASLRELFSVANVNTPAQITSNKNDYDPGDYDMLRLESDINGRTITGITGGVMGRLLYLTNIGSTTIILANASASSTVGNRIRIPGAADLTMTVSGTGNATSVLLGYGFRQSNEWQLLFRSVP